MKKPVLVLAALCSALAAAPAFAAQVSTTVHIGDLDLATVEGRAAFDHRIARAANRICTIDGDRSLQQQIESRKCAIGAIAFAHRQIASADNMIVVASR